MPTIITALTGLFLLPGSAVTQAALPALALEAAKEATYETHTVLMTGYNAVASQTDGDSHITASGAYSNPEVVAARSRDLAEELPYGTVIEIVVAENPGATCGLSVVKEHLGYRVLADTMHSRKKNQIDVLFDTDTFVKINGKQVNAAIALGVCGGVEIRVVGKVDIKKMPKTQAELALAIGASHLADAGN